MQLELGNNIRQLRRRDKRTQEALADALGVTSQAVSRWESGRSYPDMNLVPSIANYFGVSIDELFGYNNERNRKIDMLVSRINDMKNKNNGVDTNIDECVTLARAALIEFPGNERLMLCLASVLFTAGYVRYGEYHTIDVDGYNIYDTQKHRKYAEWNEAIKLYEKALASIENCDLRHKSVNELMQLYLNVGEHGKALALAESAPSIWGSKEFLRTYAYDGKDRVQAYGEALLKAVSNCAELMIQCVLAYGHNLSAAEKVQSVHDAINLFDHICTDGNFGRYNSFISRMYMLLSVYLWLDGKHDKAFESLDKSLTHFKMFEEICVKGVSVYTAPLVRPVEVNLLDEYVPDPHDNSANLPTNWPWWSVPEKEQVKSEMQVDSRWDEWVAKTQA